MFVCVLVSNISRPIFGKSYDPSEVDKTGGN